MLQDSHCVLVSRDKAPRYLKKDYVLGSYLVGGTRSEAAKRTLFSCTNETFNAWTTILSLVFVNVQFLQSRWGTLRWDAPASNWFEAFDLFYLSGTLHAPFSLCCSLWVGISLKERDFWRQLDVFFIFTASGHTFPMLAACVAELQRGTMGRSTALFFGVVLCLGLSALVCTKNVPEKWKPGSMFDIFHSHALMHVLVYLEYYFEWLFICHHRTLAAIGDR
ncbi:hypothetical protein COCOBI_03-4770 [Coccomyxa sp. Obi]|nr:hypothetical protein COCOBI_03-4770 [Coccomyxa sp. Obi]